MKKVCALGLTLGLGLVSAEIDAAESKRFGIEPKSSSPYHTQLFTGIYKQDASDAGSAQAAVLIPILQSPNGIFFTQIGRDQSFKIAAVNSANIGLRFLNDEQSRLWGLHLGYDNQKTNNNTTYHVINFGAEWRSPRWHIYGNAYLPTATKSVFDHSGVTTFALRENTDANGFYNADATNNFLRRTEEAMHGIDYNVGYTVWQPHNVRLYMGGYTYRADKATSPSGVRAQLLADIYNGTNQNRLGFLPSRISLESMVQHDSVNKTDWYAGLKFVFDIGSVRRSDAKKLSQMQQYMQYEIQRNYGTLTAHYDQTMTDVSALKNAAGNLLTIAKVNDEAEITNAITNNADVIAVQGEITNLSQFNLNDNQVLTGGDYTLNNGLKFAVGYNGKLVAASGQDLVQVGKNNTIENITLEADAKQSVIRNNQTQSIGTLTINNITAQLGNAATASSDTAAVNIKISDNSSDSNLIVKDSTFNLGTTTSADVDIRRVRAIYVNTTSGDLQTTITNNTINVANGGSLANNYGIYFSHQPNDGRTHTLTVNNIANNTISFADGVSSTGIQINASAANSSSNGIVNVLNISGNTFTFGSGRNNEGMYFYTIPTNNSQATLTINKIDSNRFSFGDGGSNSGIIFNNGDDTTSLGNTNINNITGNIVSFATGNYNTGFQFLVSSESKNGVLNASNFINNRVSFVSGNSLSGLGTQVGGYVGHGTMTLTTVHSNTFTLPLSGTNNYGFNLVAGAPFGDFDPDSTLTVNVDSNGLDLSQANTIVNGSAVNPEGTASRGSGSVVIVPNEDEDESENENNN